MIHLPSLPDILPWCFLTLGIISLWIFTKKISVSFIGLFALSGFFVGRLDAKALMVLGLVFLSLCYGSSNQTSSRWLKLLVHLFFIAMAAFLMTHQVPGFGNWKLFDAIKFSRDSIPFTMYLNLDKPFLGWVILCCLGFGNGPMDLKKWLMNVGMSLLPCLAILMLGSLAAGYVAFDPKISVGIGWWIFNNLILVCVAEEAFFRRYIKGGLSQKLSAFKYGQVLAILIASMVFGLAHFQGGLIYVFLSTIAGIFYGTVFHFSRRIETSIFTHFGLNLVHFIFFSYPALKP